MAVKLILFTFASIAIASAAENSPTGVDFGQYFGQFQEQLKPILGNFPNLANYGSGSGSGSGSGPGSGSGFGSLPSFPGFGPSKGSAPTKRQVSPDSISEWFSQFGQLGQGNNPFTGSFEFKPSNIDWGHLPFGGSSGSASASNNQS